MRFQQLLGLLLAFLPLLILAHPGRPIQQFGCDASPSAENLAAISQVVSLPFAVSGQTHKRFDGFPSSTNLSSFGQIEVDTWIHVLAVNQTVDEGWIPEENITAQMDVLNANFAPQNIKFILKGVTRTLNNDWATLPYGTELDMKRALRQGDYKTLNIYFHQYLNGGFGFAKFPGTFPEGSDDFIIDGINLLSSTVPGGSSEGYNHGKTATHEAGHWLGLLHTFMGYDCNSPTGDLIADTPAQNWPTSGCPTSRDSCPDQPGLDPIHNYMDYSTDVCYGSFTPLQTKRMHDIWHAYRSPRLCNADDCLRSLRASTIPGRLNESTSFCGELTKVIVSDITVLPSYMLSGCSIGSGNILERVSSACTCLPSSSNGVSLPSLIVIGADPTSFVPPPTDVPSGPILPYPTSGVTVTVPGLPSVFPVASGLPVVPSVLPLPTAPSGIDA